MVNQELPELIQNNDNQSRGAIQDTTLAKDVVARFVCNTYDELKRGGLEGVTAVIIGSGMYGAYCAERIYRRGGKAVLLEAGPFVISEHIQNMADGDFGVVETGGLTGLPALGEYTSPVAPSNGTKQPISFATHSYNAGGKSIRWGGWSPRLTEEDLQQWPADMSQYFRDHYRQIEFQIGAFPTADVIKGVLAEVLFARCKSLKNEAALKIVDVLPAPIAAQAEQPVSGLFSFDKYSSLPVLVETLREDAKKTSNKQQSVDDANSRRGLMLVPRCRVLRLEATPTPGGGRRVTGLRVLYGHQPPVIDILPLPENCAVVLAANSMESTRLALESFVSPAEAATTQIGRNLQVHLRTDLMVRIPRASFEADLKAAAEKIVKAQQVWQSSLEAPDPRPVDDQVAELLRTLQTAALHIQCSNGQRRYHLQVIGLANPAGVGDALLYRQDTSLPELADAVAGQQSSFIALKFILVGEILTSDKPVGSPDAPWADLSPVERDNFVGQGSNGVPQDYSARKVYTFIPLSQADEDLWLEMDKTALAVARRLAGNDHVIQYFYDNSWHTTPPVDNQLRNLHHSLGSTFHECGTMRMGNDAAHGVVDTKGKLFGIENVYCCDQAVFVTSGSANPVPTGLVVAKRVSEAIAPQPLVNEPGFTNLFKFQEPVGDFTNLPLGLGDIPGWKFLGGGRFVRRGSMVEADGGIGVLYFAGKEFKDFILKLEWQSPLLRGNYNLFNNGGIYLRWPSTVLVAPGVQKPLDQLTLNQIGDFAIKQGYEIQIDDTGYRPEPKFSGFPEELNNAFHLTGAIYPAFPSSDGGGFPPRPKFNVGGGDFATGHPARFLASKPPGQWNEYVITVQGTRIQVVLNGREVNDAVDLNNAFPQGFIGLQNHFNGYRLRYRNVRIKEL